MAPGFWRCDSIVTEYQTAMGPHPGAPPGLGMMVPVTFAQQRVCGHEYHEATDLSDGEMQYCACDTGAIGRCSVDHRPVCGYHSALRDGRRLCAECVAKFDADAANAALEAAFDGLRPRLDRVRAGCAALAGIRDPDDRLLVLLQLPQLVWPVVFEGRIDNAVRARAEPELRKILTSAARTLLEPATSPLWDVSSDDPTSWAFTPAALIRHWQQTGRLRDGFSTQLRLISYEKGVFGGMKRVTSGHIGGWQISSGSHGSSERYGSSGSPDRYVLADGTLGFAAHQKRDLPAQSKRKDIDVTDVMRLVEENYLAPPDLPGPVIAYLAELARHRIPY